MSHILHSRRFRNVKASTWKISANQAKPWILHSRFQISDFRAPCAPSQQGRKQKAECRFQISRTLPAERWQQDPWADLDFRMQNAKAKQTCGLLRNHRERFQNTDFKVLSVHGSPSKRMQISDFISELGICVREFSQLEQNDISKFRFQVACLGETQVIDFSDFSLADFGMNTEFTIAWPRGFLEAASPLSFAQRLSSGISRENVVPEQLDGHQGRVAWRALSDGKTSLVKNTS